MVQPAFPVSDPVQKILKNLAGISNSILLVEGQQQKTVLNTNSVLAYAELPEAWPKTTAIYDLGSFLGALSAFDKPAIRFEQEAMVVTNERPTSFRIKYRYSDPTTIQKVTDKALTTDNPSISFVLSAQALTTIKKTAAMLKLTHFTVAVAPSASGDETTTVILNGNDPKNPSSHGFDLLVPPADVTVHEDGYTRTMRFQVAHFAYLLDGDYTVQFAKWKYAYLTHNAAPLRYFIAEDVTK